MESKFLIDISIKYGLNSTQISKLMDIAYQSGVTDMDSREMKKLAAYVCEAGLIDEPAEEILEELKRKGIISLP